MTERDYDPAADSAGSYYAAVEAKRRRGDTSWRAPLPDYSPAMLRLMLEARLVLARDDLGQRERQFRRMTARLAGVTPAHVALAMAGRLRKAEPRTRLWAMLGHYPGLAGIVLTDRGGQTGGRHGGGKGEARHG